MNHKSQLANKFLEFKKQNLFIDFTLKVQSKQIHCHRIILSKYSKYFFREIQRNPQSKDFSVAFDPDNLFENVIDFLYAGSLKLSLSNIIPYAKLAEYYEIDILNQLIDNNFDAFFNLPNLFYLMNSCKNSKVYQFHDFFINILLPNFEKLKLDDIISNCDSRLLSTLLTKLSDTFSKSEQLRIVESFSVKNKNDLTTEDKQYLTSLFDFDQLRIEDIRLFLYGNFEWILSSVSRTLISRIIDLRRQCIEDTEVELNDKCDDNHLIGNWTAFSRISKVALFNDQDNVNLFDYIRTFDNFTQPINPFKYGFINVSSTRPISPIFGIPAMFEKDGYFASIKYGEVHPSLKISFGENTYFSVQSIQLTPVLIQEDYKPQKPANGRVEIILDLNKAGSDSYTDEFDDEIEFDECVPASSIKITMINPNSYGGWLFRVSSPNIQGKFIPI